MPLWSCFKIFLPCRPPVWLAGGMYGGQMGLWWEHYHSLLYSANQACARFLAVLCFHSLNLLLHLVWTENIHFPLSFGWGQQTDPGTVTIVLLWTVQFCFAFPWLLIAVSLLVEELDRKREQKASSDVFAEQRVTYVEELGLWVGLGAPPATCWTTAPASSGQGTNIWCSSYFGAVLVLLSTILVL